MKFITSPRLAKLAAVASIVSVMGAQTGFAAQKNQSANVFSKSKTSVTSTQIVLTGNLSSTTQLGGGFFNNQKAGTTSIAGSTVVSGINATSGNATVINQQ